MKKSKILYKRKLFILILVLCITTLILAGCTYTNFKEEDFALEISSVEVIGNKVIVEAIFENKTAHSGFIVSGGAEGKISTIINIEYKDENNEPEFGYPSIAVFHYVKAKQKIVAREEFDLKSGIYTIVCKVNIFCNGKNIFKGEDYNDEFYYETEKTVVEIK